MRLETALDEFGLLQRRKHRGEEGKRVALAHSALREYLLEHAGIEETVRVSSDDLLNFLLEYYPSQEEPEVEVAMALLEVCSGFALWLIERGERSLAAFAREEERLREDIPRLIEVFGILREHTRQGDLRSEVLVDPEEEEGSDGPLGSLSSGLDRTVRLDVLDYNRAEMDYYTVERVEEGAVALRSSGRDVLEEGLAEPVRVPLQATERLRVGDILYGEIAPGPDGWELLEVFGLRPGESA
jgi:hypothetical protein